MSVSARMRWDECECGDGMSVSAGTGGSVSVFMGMALCCNESVC